VLPERFHPLLNHYDPNNYEDHYNGWPRYIVSDRDNMVMCYVPAQTFTMGGGHSLNEVPAREVVVSHFYIDIHEVTNVQFDRFRKAAKNRGPAAKLLDPLHVFTISELDYRRYTDRPWVESQAYRRYGYEITIPFTSIQREDIPGKQKLYPELLPDIFYRGPWWWMGQTPLDIDCYLDYWTPGANNDHPVRNVSWWEAWYYSMWTNKFLPTEVEWEAAARGGDRRAYPWGNEPTSETTRYLCNCKTDRGNFDGYEYTAPVMNYAAGVSPCGAFQMSGNVGEWCADWYDPGRYAYPSDADPPSKLDRGPKAFDDPNYPNPLDKTIRETRVGPLRGDEKVIRGGSFAEPIEQCRVDSRRSARPDAHQNNVGFRCVLPLPPEATKN
jgi:formylglycine-generating enzyme required for sulfatase activity